MTPEEKFDSALRSIKDSLAHISSHIANDEIATEVVGKNPFLVQRVVELSLMMGSIDALITSELQALADATDDWREDRG